MKTLPIVDRMKTVATHPRSLVAGVSLALWIVLPVSSALAGSPPSNPSVSQYVEQLPTASGAIAGRPKAPAPAASPAPTAPGTPAATAPARTGRGGSSTAHPTTPGARSRSGTAAHKNPRHQSPRSRVRPTAANALRAAIASSDGGIGFGRGALIGTILAVVLVTALAGLVVGRRSRRTTPTSL